MKWGLVLSGGGARGYAHIGILKMLESWGLKPDIIVGTSMGSIVGGIYACGKTPLEMEKYLLEEFEIRKHLDKWILQLKGGSIIKFIQAGDVLQTMMRTTAIDSGKGILEVFRRLTWNKSFSQTQIPFACNAVDLLSGREIILDHGNVAEALRASMSLPGIFSPVRQGNMLLVDGGVLNSAPIWIAEKMGAKRILCVKVGEFVSIQADELSNAISIFFRTFSITAHALHALEKSRKRDRSVLEIRVSDVSRILDFERKEELVRLGESVALENKREIMKRFSSRKLFWKR